MSRFKIWKQVQWVPFKLHSGAVLYKIKEKHDAKKHEQASLGIEKIH